MKSWQDAAIYFILIDRFCNGDKSNDDQGCGEFDPANDEAFHGGDLAGIKSKLPYIRDLGFDAIWITPPVRNQWINPYVPTRGYHGYWAQDFTKVDPHFGTIEEYRGMVDEAHRLGLRVIQDIVVNHTGNFFTVDAKDYDPLHPERNWRPAGPAAGAPDDPLFRLNDPNNAEHKAAAVYNFTPNISDFKDREQTLTWSMGDLDDLNLKNPRVIERFKEIYRYWIDAAGVDGFRVDTVYYTPKAFYEPFLHDADGIKAHAAKAGKPDFLVFGEVWSYDYRAIRPYVRERGRARLDSAVDLPLNEALTQVFFRKAPTERLKAPLEAKRPNRHLWVNFLDNHDVERIHARGDWAAVRQSLAALFTLPGIPCVTYGTEAGLTRTRADMFDDARFDPSSKAAAFIREMLAFRRAHPAFSRGACRVEQCSPAPGFLSYSISWQEERYEVLFNTAAHPILCSTEGGKTILSSEGGAGKQAPRVMILEPNGYRVLAIPPASVRAAAAPELGLRLPAKAVKGKVGVGLELAGASALSELCLLVNGDIAHRLAVPGGGSPLPGGSTLELDTSVLGNGRHALRLAGRTPSGDFRLSPPAEIVVRNPYRLLARARVAAEDKGGLGGRVHLPADPSYRGQLSMEEVGVCSSGRDLQLRLRMSEVTADWNPPHGFDHVYFSVFFSFPGQAGKPFFPKLGFGREDFEFNLGFLLYGWDTRSFKAEDSTPDRYGSPVPGDVAYAVDRRRATIRVTLSRGFFDAVPRFEGTRIFISTWDGYLGELRSLETKKEDWNFYVDGGGGALPKVYDHAMIRL